MFYSASEIKIIRDSIPNIEGGDDPFSTVRWLLDLFLDTREWEATININTVLESKSFKEYVKKYEREIVKAVEDVEELKVYKEEQKEYEIIDDIEDVFDELVDLTEKTWEVQSYPIKLKMSWWLVEYEFRWSLIELGDYIIDICWDASEYIDERIEAYVKSDIETQKIKDHPSYFQLEFYLSSSWWLILEIDEIAWK